MNNCFFIKDSIAFAKLLEKEPNLLLTQVIFVIKDILFKVSLVTVLHDDIKVVLTRNLDLHTVNKIWMMWKFSEHG